MAAKTPGGSGCWMSSPIPGLCTSEGTNSQIPVGSTCQIRSDSAVPQHTTLPTHPCAAAAPGDLAHLSCGVGAQRKRSGRRNRDDLLQNKDSVWERHGGLSVPMRRGCFWPVAVLPLRPCHAMLLATGSATARTMLAWRSTETRQSLPEEKFDGDWREEAAQKRKGEDCEYAISVS